MLAADENNVPLLFLWSQEHHSVRAGTIAAFLRRSAEA
jgi:hypothetical protein